MNQARRKQLESIINKLADAVSDLQELETDEQEALDSLPENIQSSDRGEEMAHNVEVLGEAHQSIQTTIDELEGIE